MRHARRPAPARRTHALPTLVALLAAGVTVEGCLTDAHAQTPPSGDAGVRPHHPPHPPHPQPLPPGGIRPVQPHPTPPTPPPPPPQEPPSVDGGIGKISAYLK